MQLHFHRTTRSTMLMLALLLAVLSVGLGSAGAQDAPQFDPFTSTTNVNVLRAEAVRAGSLRVIVGVQANYNGLAGLDGVAADSVRSQISRSAQDTLLSSLSASGVNVQVVRQFDFIPFMTLRVDAAALDALAANPLVTSIENDALAMLDMNSSAGVIGASGAGGAWDMGYTGDGFTVAVLDTGVDKVHPYLSGQVVSEACYNTNDAGTGAATRCPGGVESSEAVGSGVDCIGTFADGCEHGTHVAGTVASTDGTYRGIAPDATLIAINVFSVFPDTFSSCGAIDCLLSFTTDQVDGLNRVYALRNDFDIASINMSLGGGQFFDEASCDVSAASRKTVIDLLRTADIATVISSGNNGFTSSMGAPGCISTAVSVGATDDADNVASFSNVATFMEVFAPGVSISSAKSGTATFQTYQGTSMSAPHVAGAWAVMRQGDPDGTVTEILGHLTSTGVSVTDARVGGTITKPRIQLNDALVAMLDVETPTGVTATAEGQTIIDVNWDDVTGETGYSVESSPDGITGWTEVGTPAANDTSFSHTGLDCDTVYYYRVSAVNGGLTSDPSTVVNATTDACTVDSELLVNGNFDDNDDAPASLPDDWNGSGQLKGDKVRVDGANTVSNSAPNTFQFMGYPQEKNSKIAQAVDLLSVTIEAGDQLVLSAYVDQRSANVNVLIGQLVVMYNDAPNDKVKLKMPAVKTPGYVKVSTPAITITNTNIKKISAQLLYKSPAGKFYIDDVSLTLSEPIVLLNGGLVPLPAAPGDLRGQ